MDHIEPKKDYTVNDCFQITLPGNWNIIHPISITVFSPNEYLTIRVNAFPRENSIDITKRMSGLQKEAVNSKDCPHTLKDSGIVHIHNREAHWSLFSLHESAETVESYWLIYYVDSDEYCYGISFRGEYDKFNCDRKVIDEFISNFKIIK